MKVTTIIDPDREEEVVLYLHSNSDLPQKIERLLSAKPAELMGFQGEKMVPLNYVKVDHFTVEGGKTYARMGRESYWVKKRLYQIEQEAPSYFVKIHQSCLANLRQVSCFEATFSGNLRVVFKNGDEDYVSRRQLKIVKERLGV